MWPAVTASALRPPPGAAHDVDVEAAVRALATVPPATVALGDATASAPTDAARALCLLAGIADPAPIQITAARHALVVAAEQLADPVRPVRRPLCPEGMTVRFVVGARRTRYNRSCPRKG